MKATSLFDPATQRYAKCIEISKRVRWDIDRDVIRGRDLDLGQKYLPDGLSLADRLHFLTPEQGRFLSQIQGRTYANMFGIVERFIGAKMLEVCHQHALGDQVALEALVRFTNEELKHQELFRRIEALTAIAMPAGYSFVPDANTVAEFVLGKTSWAVLALTCHIELFSQMHYRESIDGDDDLSPLFRDVFLFHWKEESQHAVLDEIEWYREDARIDDAERDKAVDDFIALVSGIDGLLQLQAHVDTKYFLDRMGDSISEQDAVRVGSTFLQAYRWQYILSGAGHPHFVKLLAGLATDAQLTRISAALATLQSKKSPC